MSSEKVYLTDEGFLEIETELKEEDNRYNTFKKALELQLIANAKQVAVDKNIIL